MAASPMIFVIAALYKAAPYLLSGAFYSNVHFPTINIGYGMDYSAVAQMYADAVGKFWRALTVPQGPLYGHGFDTDGNSPLFL